MQQNPWIGLWNSIVDSKYIPTGGSFKCPRDLTEIKTKLSQFGRSITAIAAEEADIDHFLYTGPDDGITRDFCEALVNKVVTSKQMRRLDNGQGLSVITSGGGYNCRHSWSPVTQGFIKSANLELATAKDINKANQWEAKWEKQ